MTRRTRIWQVVTGLFILINVGGAVFAVLEAELDHALVHVALGIAGLYFGRRFWSPREAEPELTSGPLDDRLANLEQSIDAVAIEIERIGEGQRFMTRTLTEKPPKPPRSAGEPD